MRRSTVAGGLLTRELPFAEAEYRDRARRVREEMSRRDVDVLFVMSPANLCYLTGFESIWYPPRAPLGVVVSRRDDRLVFLDYERHETLVRHTALVDDAVFYRYEDALDSIAAAFRKEGGTRERSVSSGGRRRPVGHSCARRQSGWVRSEQRSSTATGSSIAFGQSSPRRRSSASAERRRSSMWRSQTCSTASGRVRRSSRSPLAWTVPWRIRAVSRRPFGRWFRQAPTSGTGRTRAPSRRPLEVGDVMYVDACGVFNRYHADLCRTVAIGRDHPEARRILEQTAGSVEEVQRVVRPGDPLDVAQRVGEDYVFARIPARAGLVGRRLRARHRDAPSWVGHTYLSNDAFESFTWEPGYVTNYENILFDRERGFTASYMETLVMTRGRHRSSFSASAELAIAGSKQR